MREPREAYIAWADRLTVLISLVAPGLAGWMLARSFGWEKDWHMCASAILTLSG